MTNKIIKIPISDVDGLRSDGGYSLRYRIVSKDGNRKSEWSDLTNINYESDLTYGYIKSFYERQGFGKPYLSYYNTTYVPPGGTPDPNNYLDPHTIGTTGGIAYSVPSVSYLLNSDQYITSSISIPEDTEGVLTYSWGSLENLPYPPEQKFDVYLSYRDATFGWSDWSFAGTTTSNNFSFTSPSQGQYVQAAVFLSSYPKLTNIYNQPMNFVSISSQFNVYRDAGSSTITASATAPAAGGKYSATITNLNEAFPTTGYSGRRVYADSGASTHDRAAFGDAKVTVKSRVSTSTTSIIVESNTVLPTTTLYNVSLI
jgi:hypothetical protein